MIYNDLIGGINVMSMRKPQNAKSGTPLEKVGLDFSENLSRSTDGVAHFCWRHNSKFVSKKSLPSESPILLVEKTKTD